MKWALVDSNNVVQNTIAYDPALPHGPYTPPDGLTLMEVNDWCEKDQPVTDTPPVVVLTTEQKNDAVLAQLDALDVASMRPLRAVLNAIQAGQAPSPMDIAKLAAHDTQAATLRETLIS